MVVKKKIVALLLRLYNCYGSFQVNWVKGNLRTLCTTTMGRLDDHIKSVWRSADAVCFDVDSTVCTDEAIDELAKFVGREKEVAEM